MSNKKQKMVEVCRSFSYKLNVGNFESRDFFCSQKAEVPLVEAEQISELLYEFCKNEVVKSVNKYRAENQKPKDTAVLVSTPDKPVTAKESQAMQEKADDLKEKAIKEDEKLKVESQLPIVEQ